MDFVKLFDDFRNIKIGIVGDVMLDTYLFGNVERISPEAPVPVVSLKRKEYRLGGASNVALNTVALNAPTFTFSVVGKDEEAQSLTQLLQNNHINIDGIISSEKRITTNKTRVVSKNQQMMRLDAEITKDIDEETENILLQNLTHAIKKHQLNVLIFEDYNKGVLTHSFIQQAIQLCKVNNVITTVDPKRKNFFSFKQADIFKPNLKEVIEALNIIATNVDEGAMMNIHAQLYEKLQHQHSLITLSEKGVFFNDETKPTIIPTHERKIADVSGAGDTVIAVASLVFAATKNIQLAAQIANIAGGLVCEEVGTTAISKEKLLKETVQLLS